MTIAIEMSDKRRLLLDKLLRKEGIAKAEPQGIPRRSGNWPAPLSFGQQRLWFLNQLAPESTAYNLTEAVRLRGPLEAEVLARALAEVVRRHESLRTVFEAPAGEAPLQVVTPPAAPSLPCLDLADLPQEQRLAEATRIASRKTAEPFDLVRGPLFKADLLRLDTADHVLLLRMHHIVSDGWSMGILVRELTILYGAFGSGQASPLAELPLQYPDFAVWQRGWLQGEVLKEQLRYWQESLAGAPTLLDLPTDRPRPPIQSFRGGRELLQVDRNTTSTLREIARSQGGATLFMALLAGLGALLQRYSHQDDILIGSPNANRNRPETEGLIGFFVNTVVLRTDLSGNPDLPSLLARVREAALAADAHQDLPFERLIDALDLPRDLSVSPLFQVMLTFQNLPPVAESPQSLTLAPFSFENERAQFDLHFLISEGPQGLVGALEYRTDLFEPPTIRRLARHFEALLAAAAQEPARPVSSLSLLSAPESHQLLREWNDTVVADPAGLCLHHLVEAQVERSPGAVAATFEDRSLTYAELNARANLLARKLRALGCGPETRVGVAMERSLELPVALLAVLKAGAAYVPLDPEYPRERLAFMLEDSRPAVLLTQERLRPHLPPCASPVLCLDAEPDPPAGDAANLGLPLADLHSAYMIYTSGSTGWPKGAVVHHGGIRNRLLWMQEAYRLSEADTVLQKTPFSFDVSVWEFFWPLLAGARLVLARPGGHREGSYLVSLIEQEQVSVLHFVPSMLQVFLEEDDIERCRSLRLVVASGEALPPELARRFFERLGARLENLYGPTEASVDVTSWSCRPQAEPRSVPIGRPIANTRIHLLDRWWSPVPLGVAGELAIGGLNVGRGYLGRPELTADSFVPDPFAAEPGARLYRTRDLARHLPGGAVEYLGRIDHQVKVRGFRIELGEIETVLGSHPAVREVAVTLRQDGPGGQRRLVAYVVLLEGEALPLEELRRFAAARLPDYMLPAASVRLDAMPLSPNGKVDRRALPAPDTARPEMEQAFVPPTTPLEAALAEIWKQALGRDRVGINDNFFALGGDSILSIRILSRARDLGFSMTLQQIFQHQTLADLARALGRGEEEADDLVQTAPFELVSEADRQLLPDGVEDAYPLSRTQAGMLFHSELSPETAVYHDVIGNSLRGPFDEATLRRSLEQVMARHPLLRTAFHLKGFSEPLQLVHAAAPVPLEVYDLRELPDEAQQAALTQWMETERHRDFDWTCPPLLRFQVHRLADDRFLFTLSFHHAVLDGWSMASLTTELFRTYMTLFDHPAAPSSPPLDSTFRDYVRLERRIIESPESKAFWDQRLAGAAFNRLPRWPAIRAGAARAHDLEVAIPADTAGKLTRLSQALAVPLKSLLLAAHLRIVRFLSGETDVTIGLVTHGRPQQTGGDQVLGLFLNTLPLRLRLGEESWDELIRAAFEAEREILPYRRYPLADIQASRGGRRLFETSFGFNYFHVFQQTRDFSGMESLGTHGYEETDIPFQASFHLDPAGSNLGLRLNYLDSEFSPEQVSWAAGLYTRALDALAADPKARHGEVSLLSSEERRQILEEWSRGGASAGQRRPLDELLAEQAALTPGAPAVVAAGASLSFGELEERANRLARYLRRRGVGTESRVGLCLDRSADLVVAVLAVLKAGAAYVPIDPSNPGERKDFLLADAGVSVRLDREHLAASAREIADESAAPVASGASPEALAYVIYTSGSTGRPKGVMVTHGGLCNYLLWAASTYVDPEAGGSLLHSSIGFDLTVTSLFVPLLCGRPVVLVPESEGVEMLAAALGGSRGQGLLSFVKLTPSHARALARELSAGGDPASASRSLILGGEVLLAEDMAPWRERAPETVVFNEYGPTEAVVGCSVWAAKAGDLETGPVPIGRPIAGAQLLLLDPFLEPVPPGTPGELWIGGACLARGYLGRPEQTADRFRPDPFTREPGGRLYRTGDLARWRQDRALDYLGRIDDQVKIRGYRIEPAEIEAALARHPDVREAAVVVSGADGGGGGSLLLVAFAVPRDSSAQLTAEAVRSSLKGWLPAYMVPAQIVLLPELPLTPNGKVDRRSLLDHEALRAERGESYVAPRTPTEERLAALWAEGLGIDRVGIHDNFLDIGGHSLLAIQVMQKVREEFDVRLPLRTLYSARTVANLAVALVNAQAEKADAELLAELLQEVERTPAANPPALSHEGGSKTEIPE